MRIVSVISVPGTRLRVSAPLIVALALVGGAILETGSQAAAAPNSHVRTATLKEAGWSATATHFRGKIGLRYMFLCPFQGTKNTVWGTGTYTDDSSVCTAAVHAGRLTLASGGSVVIEMRPGLASYKASTRHGVTTVSYGSWWGSYVIVSATRGRITVTLNGGAGWSAAATSYRGLYGLRFSYACSAGGTTSKVWGTNIYTDDSPVCTSAVHAGRFPLASGGRVVIEILPGQRSYTGTTRNGITTSSYGIWSGSYKFVS
jgi:hypothetical protein